MISNSILSKATSVENLFQTGGTKVEVPYPSVCVVGEYFFSNSIPSAKSDIDYLISPLTQIRNQINSWLRSLGSQTQIETEEATLLVAPTASIPQEYFDSYESVFRTVMLYRAGVSGFSEDFVEGPSDAQKNAALLGLANLILEMIPVPLPMFLEDGTIGAYWRCGKHYASIDFEVDGEHSWAETNGTEFNSGTWRLPGDRLPSALTQKLLSFCP